MAKSLVEVYSKYISKQANDLKYVGQPLVEETNAIVPEGPHKGKKVEDLTMDQHDQQLAHYHSKKITSNSQIFMIDVPLRANGI